MFGSILRVLIYLEIPIVKKILLTTIGRDLGKRKLDIRVDAPVALLYLALADAWSSIVALLLLHFVIRYPNDILGP